MRKPNNSMKQTFPHKKKFFQLQGNFKGNRFSTISFEIYFFGIHLKITLLKMEIIVVERTMLAYVSQQKGSNLRLMSCFQKTYLELQTSLISSSRDVFVCAACMTGFPSLLSGKFD